MAWRKAVRPQLTGTKTWHGLEPQRPDPRETDRQPAAAGWLSEPGTIWPVCVGLESDSCRPAAPCRQTTGRQVVSPQHRVRQPGHANRFACAAWASASVAGTTFDLIQEWLLWSCSLHCGKGPMGKCDRGRGDTHIFSFKSTGRPVQFKLFGQC